MAIQLTKKSLGSSWEGPGRECELKSGESFYGEVEGMGRIGPGHYVFVGRHIVSLYTPEKMQTLHQCPFIRINFFTDLEVTIRRRSNR